jgi:hypothetical protein
MSTIIVTWAQSQYGTNATLTRRRRSYRGLPSRVRSQEACSLIHGNRETLKDVLVFYHTSKKVSSQKFADAHGGQHDDEEVEDDGQHDNEDVEV